MSVPGLQPRIYAAQPTQREAHIYDLAARRVVAERATAQEIGRIDEAARPGHGDRIFICPGCHAKGHIHRLAFRSAHDQTIEIPMRNPQTFEEELVARRYHIPASFAGWPNGGEHECDLKKVLGRFHEFAKKRGARPVGPPEAGVYKFNMLLPGSPALVVSAPSRRAITDKFAAGAESSPARREARKRKAPLSKGLKSIEDLAALYEETGGDPELLARQIFRDPPHELSGAEIFLMDPERQFQELFQTSEERAIHASVFPFAPLPYNIGKQYCKQELTIAGLAQPMMHGATKIFVAPLLEFENAELYRKACQTLAQQKAQDAPQRLLVAGYGRVDIDEFHRKLDNVEYGRTGAKDYRTVWMRYRISSEDQFMPAKSAASAPASAPQGELLLDL